MNLTDKQEKFCQHIVKGENQYKSYCLAYPEQAKSSKRETLDTNAYILSNNTEIVNRIKELRLPAVKKTLRTLDTILNEIDELKKNTLDDKLKLDCLKHEAKLKGFEVNKQDLTSDGDKLTNVLISGFKQAKIIDSE